MKPHLRRLLLVAGIAMIAAILAVPMRGTIYNAIVVPAAYIAWALGLAYRSLPQVLLWWLVIVIIFFILLFNTLPQLKPVRKEKVRPKPTLGQVQNLSIWIGRSKSGVYFKWLIANRLGKLAYNILLLRESGRPRSVFTPLVGEDWQPSKELQTYLENGLHGSFSDFPNSKNRLAAQPKTPLDYEVREAVEFLESHLEKGNGRLGR